MADRRPRTRRASGHAGLPALDRLAPRPDPLRVAAEISARTSPGDVVLELHGRGAWIARGALDDLRRAFVIEGSALTRLIAEVVLRPPDLRRLDAAVSAIAVDARGPGGGLRHEIESMYTSACATCQAPVVVEEFIWEAEATDPSERIYSCKRCGHGQGRAKPVEVDADDLYRARSIDPDAARAALELRFPTEGGDRTLPSSIMALFPPRAQVALWALLERIEDETRPPSVTAALRLALVELVVGLTRLDGSEHGGGRLRISGGRVVPPSTGRWRERNAWLEFDAAAALVRAFVAALVADDVPAARPGADLRALVDGAANVALRIGVPVGPETFGPPPRSVSEPGARPRVRPGIDLVLSQTPLHWTADATAFAYLATSLGLGPDAARTLPLETIFEAGATTGRARETAMLRNALAAVGPVLAPDADIVLLLERAGPEEMVSAVIGGTGAGLRVDDAVLDEGTDGISGTVSFHDPATSPHEDRDVALRSASDRGSPFQISAVEAAITDIAVAVIQLRGEPTTFERILGEVLLGLDRLGHLRRLVGVRPRTTGDAGGVGAPRASGLWGEPVHAMAEGSPATVDDDEDGDDGPATDDAGAATHEGPRRSRSPARSDPVATTLDIIRRELTRDDQRRLVRLDDGRWWLRDATDLAALKSPLSERAEWGIFSLLSTSGGISEASFRERVGRLYRGPETADSELTRAIVRSYRRRRSKRDGRIHTDETLPDRYRDHGEIVGHLTRFGHRLGMRAWIAKREQRRRFEGAPLADLLDETEQRVYLPLVAPGPVEVLEGIDCIWYVRGRGAFLFDVEWMAALDEPILRRGPRIESTDSVVRFLVIPDERVGLVRLRLERSTLLRDRMGADNWHILKWSHVRRLASSKRASLSALSPLIGLDPTIESDPAQMDLFE